MQIPKLRLDEETLSSIFIIANPGLIFQSLVRLITEGDIHIDRIDRLGDDERLEGAVLEFYCRDGSAPVPPMRRAGDEFEFTWCDSFQLEFVGLGVILQGSKDSFCRTSTEHPMNSKIVWVGVEHFYASSNESDSIRRSG